MLAMNVMGIILKNNPKVVEALYKIAPNLNLSRVNITGLFGNLLPVTIGNIIGGGIIVALIYWIIIIHPQKRKERKLLLELEEEPKKIVSLN